MATLPPDPRRAPRVPTSLRVELVCAGTSWLATTLDLSAGGCALRSERGAEPGTALVMLVRPPGQPGVLGVEGRVVWCRPPYLAIRFGRTLSGERPVDLAARLLGGGPAAATSVGPPRGSRTLGDVAAEAGLPPELVHPAG